MFGAIAQIISMMQQLNIMNKAGEMNVIELFNVIITFICGLIAGAAIHSAWLHSKNRKRVNDK